MEELFQNYYFITGVKTFVIFSVLMTTLAYLQWVERKVIAHIQVRPGPYRVVGGSVKSSGDVSMLARLGPACGVTWTSRETVLLGKCSAEPPVT